MVTTVTPVVVGVVSQGVVVVMVVLIVTTVGLDVVGEEGLNVVGEVEVDVEREWTMLLVVDDVERDVVERVGVVSVDDFVLGNQRFS
jgi:hypothetical protein